MSYTKEDRKVYDTVRRAKATAKRLAAGPAFNKLTSNDKLQVRAFKAVFWTSRRRGEGWEEAFVTALDTTDDLHLMRAINDRADLIRQWLQEFGAVGMDAYWQAADSKAECGAVGMTT